MNGVLVRSFAMSSTDMAGRVCLVTGASSGIGKETARGLAALGATVVMAVRDRNRGERVRDEIVSDTRNSEVHLEICDLLLMDSVREFAKRFASSHDSLDVLVNNAGGVFNERQTTPEGFERTLALNYLAPFLLSRELVPLVVSRSDSRVINVGSGDYYRGQIDVADLKMADKYNPRRAYSKAKLMLTMFTYELARRLATSAVTANVVQPGFVATSLGKNSGSRLLSASFLLMRPFQISAQKAAESLVYLSSSADVKGVTGRCFRRTLEVRTSPFSYDEAMQKRLWDATSVILGLPQELGS
jgi:NAD(P)-dependent dehydrogenase (short-subunit alcohol dehydrogenase family)